jgi:hypothetical protein
MRIGLRGCNSFASWAVAATAGQLQETVLFFATLIGIVAVKKWIVRVLPILNSVAHGGEGTHQLLRRDHNSRDCAACDVAGSEQQARAFVPLGGYASANRRHPAQLRACARLN